ncbi:MAG TPA: TolC family outer membrane protein [Burkholderiales bacterium]|nr:TolC family outer membrane protein [Burkholderiales bacterium]
MRAFVLAAVALLSLPAYAADLLEIFRQAQGVDPSYASARAAWAAAQERLPQGRAGLLPVVSLSASAQQNHRVTTVEDGQAPRSTLDFGSTALTLSVTQPLYRRQNIVLYEQARSQVTQADAQLDVAAQDLIMRVAQAYFDVLLAQDNVSFAEAQKRAIDQQLQHARRTYEIGTAPITDVHEAQARYDITNSQELAARNELELRRRALEQLIERTAPRLAPLGARFQPRPAEPATVDPWIALARHNNAQVRVAHAALEVASQEIDRNRSAHYPSFDAFATASHSGGTPVTTLSTVRSDTRSAAIGVQLAVPIYQGGALNSRVREAIANQERARHDLRNAQRTAEFAARQSFLGIAHGISQVHALEAALASTESQLTSTRRGREVGVRTQLDVLNAQQQLFSSRRDLAQAKYNYVLSLLRLEAAIGELTEDDLAAINQWLDRSGTAR